MSAYLQLLRAASTLQHRAIDGFLIVGDADTSHVKAFQYLSESITEADLPVPSQPFVIENIELDGEHTRVGIYIIPGKGRTGCLEHLLLEAVLSHDPSKHACIDGFMRCVRSPTDCTENQLAKMKLSSLIGASCRKNPFASSGLVWKDDDNPIPIDSECFNDLSLMLKQFASPTKP